MAMLAGIKKQKKYSVNPNGLDWTNDESKLGHRLLEKMGWEKGKGLGRELTGISEPVLLRKKDNNFGVGCTAKHADNWIAHQDDFNSLLSSLQDNHSGSGSNTPNNNEESAVASLEEKSKTSKGRVHYHKFTRGKDLSAYKGQDLNCILGKRKRASQQLEETEKPEDIEPKKPSVENGSNTTVSAHSVQEYFAMKMAALKKLRDKKNDVVDSDCTSQSNVNIGADDNGINGEVETPEISKKRKRESRDESEDADSVKSKKKRKKEKKDKKMKTPDEPPSSETVADVDEDSSKSKKHKKKKKSADKEEDLSPDEKKSKKKKKKSKSNGDNDDDDEKLEAATKIEDGSRDDDDVQSVDVTVKVKKSKKKKKSRDNETTSVDLEKTSAKVDEPAPVADETSSEAKKSKKSKRKDVESDAVTSNVSVSNSSDVSSKKMKKSKKSKRKTTENNAMTHNDSVSNSSLESVSADVSSKKAKKSKKSRKNRSDDDSKSESDARTTTNSSEIASAVAPPVHLKKDVLFQSKRMPKSVKVNDVEKNSFRGIDLSNLVTGYGGDAYSSTLCKLPYL
ncbi:uncharacterized protein LOC141912638 [Tubulanus polymorphus]|uniref:uncharacterized protein LOC141912638 n=1 Tax=Tubulanus polymorphus TaxID=672921 RepID=UPI003DA48D69